MFKEMERIEQAMNLKCFQFSCFDFSMTEQYHSKQLIVRLLWQVVDMVKRPKSKSRQCFPFDIFTNETVKLIEQMAGIVIGKKLYEKSWELATVKIMEKHQNLLIAFGEHTSLCTA